MIVDEDSGCDNNGFPHDDKYIVQDNNRSPS